MSKLEIINGWQDVVDFRYWYSGAKDILNITATVAIGSGRVTTAKEYHLATPGKCPGKLRISSDIYQGVVESILMLDEAAEFSISSLEGFILYNMSEVCHD